MKALIRVYKLNEQIYYRLKDLRRFAYKNFDVGRTVCYKCGWLPEDIYEPYFTDEKSFVVTQKHKDTL